MLWETLHTRTLSMLNMEYKPTSLNQPCSRHDLDQLTSQKPRLLSLLVNGLSIGMSLLRTERSTIGHLWYIGDHLTNSTSRLTCTSMKNQKVSSSQIMLTWPFPQWDLANSLQYKSRFHLIHITRTMNNNKWKLTFLITICSRVCYHRQPRYSPDYWWKMAKNDPWATWLRDSWKTAWPKSIRNCKVQPTSPRVASCLNWLTRLNHCSHSPTIWTWT